MLSILNVSIQASSTHAVSLLSHERNHERCKKPEIAASHQPGLPLSGKDFLQMNASRKVRFIPCAVAMFALLIFASHVAQAQSIETSKRQIPTSGQGTFQPQPMGQDGIQAIEIDDLAQDADSSDDSGFINRTCPAPSRAREAKSTRARKPNQIPKSTWHLMV